MERLPIRNKVALKFIFRELVWISFQRSGMSQEICKVFCFFLSPIYVLKVVLYLLLCHYPILIFVNIREKKPCVNFSILFGGKSFVRRRTRLRRNVESDSLG